MDRINFADGYLRLAVATAIATLALVGNASAARTCPNIETSEGRGMYIRTSERNCREAANLSGGIRERMPHRYSFNHWRCEVTDRTMTIYYEPAVNGESTYPQEVVRRHIVCRRWHQWITFTVDFPVAY